MRTASPIDKLRSRLRNDPVDKEEQINSVSATTNAMVFLCLAATEESRIWVEYTVVRRAFVIHGSCVLRLSNHSGSECNPKSNIFYSNSYTRMVSLLPDLSHSPLFFLPRPYLSCEGTSVLATTRWMHMQPSLRTYSCCCFVERQDE